MRPAVPTLAGSVQSDVEGNIRGALWVRDIMGEECFASWWL